MHVRDAEKGEGFYLHRAIRKYGPEVFTVEVIYRAKTLAELFKMETFFIVLHQSHATKNGYNLTLGGEGVPGNTWNKGRKWAPEVIARRAASNRGKKRDAEQLANLKAGWLACAEKKSKTVKALWGSSEFRDKQKLAHQDLPRDTQGRYLAKAAA